MTNNNLSPNFLDSDNDGKKENAPYELMRLLLEMRGFQKLNVHFLRLLNELNGGLSFAVQEFLCLCFSLFDDGNVRVPLEQKLFLKMWDRKWCGLSLMNESLKTPAKDFETIIAEGLKAFSDENLGELEKIIRVETSDAQGSFHEIPEEEISAPLIVTKGKIKYLYSARHFNSKCIIESRMRTLFKTASLKGRPEISKSEIDSCIQKNFELSKGNSFHLNREQACSVIRGAQENLFITGGPGTGKTTVVFYILWNLLEEKKKRGENLSDISIWLAAPSGKAADRMKESLLSSLDRLAEEADSSIKEKLLGLESSTLHSLLGFPKRNAFTKENRFSENSIFVIDEASMIDIDLFSSLLSSIPENARLFILGDPNQLPSVNSGAVLGDILNGASAQKFVSQLKETNRSSNAQEIAELSECIREGKNSPETFEEKLSEKNWDFEPFDKSDSKSDFSKQVSLITLYESENSKRALDENLNQFLFTWVKDLYELYDLATSIDCSSAGYSDKDQSKEAQKETERRREIFEISLSKKILSAERLGMFGVENLNRKIKKLFRAYIQSKNVDRPEKESTLLEQEFFPGELLMITQNQKMFNLFNGDSGIVVFKDNIPHLMLKKPSFSKTRDDYVFYPLSSLLSSSYEEAFAITVHKSQGSEYKKVSLFLPQKIGHPLLNNQIVYTGVTRAKEQLEIISGKSAFLAGISPTIRETGIEL